MTKNLETQTIIDLVRGIAGEEPLMFDTALAIKANPHSVTSDIWGIQISPTGQIYLADWTEGQNLPEELRWDQLTTLDRNYNLIISSLYQRLYLISNQKKTA